MRQRKTQDIWEIQGYYAHGWETVTAETTFSAARSNVKAYRDNERGTSFRIVMKREPLEANHD